MVNKSYYRSPHTYIMIATILPASRIVKNMLDQSIYVLTTAFLADFVWRMCKFSREYVYYRNYYVPKRRLRNMLKRVFSYNTGTQFSALTGLFIALLRFGFTSRFPLVPINYLMFMPLYWIGLNFMHSTLDYADWIRERHGLDLAAGMAANYFHGYLKLTMPSSAEQPGIRERIEMYSAKHNITFAVSKLIILLPNDMFTHGEIKSKYLERAQPLEVIMKDRAGVRRPFKNDVYRIKSHINGKIYYLAVEGASPLLSYSDSMRAEVSCTWHMREMQREILLKFYKELKRLLNDWLETRDLVELVIYNTYTADGQLQDVGEVLVAHVTNILNEVDTS